ncbi:hypothetical protein J6590_091658 [Homalodisca vitripennis]|nr:hypothetical protein J6590_091658 [Homalodisca vitripennis]
MPRHAHQPNVCSSASSCRPHLPFRSSYPPRPTILLKLHTPPCANRFTRSCAETRFRQSTPDAAAVTSELRLTALPRVERFPNLKSTPSNGMTTTTIDEKNKSTHLLVKMNVFSFKNKKEGIKLNHYNLNIKNSIYIS